MSNNQFSALLALITPEITALITKNSNITETQAPSYIKNLQMKALSYGTTAH